MMCGVENPLQRVMPSTISTSTTSNGPLHSSTERDEIGIPGNDRLDLSCTSSSSPSKHQDFDKPAESGSLSDVSQRRRNSENNLLSKLNQFLTILVWYMVNNYTVNPLNSPQVSFKDDIKAGLK